MYIKIDNKKIKVQVLNTFRERFKSFKFKFDEIDYAICFINKKIISTYFFVQNTDIIFTDKDNKILKISRNVKTEKILFSPSKTKYTYILKNNTTNNLNINDIVKVKD